MKRINIKEVYVQTIREWFGGSHINDDLIIFDRIGNDNITDKTIHFNCVFIGLCVTGNARYTLDTEEYSISKGNLIVMNDGQLMKCRSISDNFKGIAIVATPKFFYSIIRETKQLSELLLFTRNHPVLHLGINETKSAIAYLDMLRLKINRKDHHYKEVVLSLLAAMIYDLNGIIFKIQADDKKKTTRADEIFSDFILLVEKNFKTNRHVEWYADQLYMTPKYLLQNCKQVSHHTPSEWIDSYVILEIRRLLKTTTKTVKEIAKDLNFSNQSFLCTYFKNIMGMSPSKFRKQ